MDFQRIKSLRDELEQHELDGSVVIPGPTLFYLTGQQFHLMERPVYLLLVTDLDPVMVLPEFETARLEADRKSLQLFGYAEDDASRAEALVRAVEHIGSGPKKFAVEPLGLRYFEYGLIRSAAPDWNFQDASGLFTSLRVRKDDHEIKNIQKAVDIAESALASTLPHIRAGMTERDIAAELVIQLLRAGSEPELPFQPIIASGPNSALPHATPTDRKIIRGDLLLFDWGARYNGYISDITRTFAISEIKPEFEQAYRIVREANAAGQSVVQPGATCHAVDEATRQVILEAGYAEFFTHRTGHGIGLEAHEPPNVRAGDQFKIEAGMTFTIEPGIYMPDRGGIRIEDNVVVTADGCRCLTSYPRELTII